MGLDLFERIKTKVLQAAQTASPFVKPGLQLLQPQVDSNNTELNNYFQNQRTLRSHGIYSPPRIVPARAALTDFAPQVDSVVSRINRIVPRTLGAFGPIGMGAEMAGANVGLGDILKTGINLFTGGAYNPDEQAYFRRAATGGSDFTPEEIAAAKNLDQQDSLAIGGAVGNTTPLNNILKGTNAIRIPRSKATFYALPEGQGVIHTSRPARTVSMLDDILNQARGVNTELPSPSSPPLLPAPRIPPQLTPDQELAIDYLNANRTQPVSEENIVKEVVEKVKSGPLKKIEDLFREWVNTREGVTNWRAGNIKRNPSLTAFDEEGMQAINDLQAGANSDRFRPIKEFTDTLFNEERKRGLVTDADYRQNYLPQIWADAPKQVQQAFQKFINQNPSFAKSRQFNTYLEGMQEAGLTPKYNTISDLLESRATKSYRSIADSDFAKSLVENGGAAPVSQAPKGWKVIPDLTYEGQALAGPEELVNKIQSYLAPATPWLEKAANTVSKIKQTALSAGIPYTGFNFHSGVNVPMRAAMSRSNPIAAVADSLLWNAAPGKAEEFIASLPPDHIENFLRNGMTLSRERIASDYGGRLAGSTKGWLGKAIDGFDAAFGKATFEKIIPAHKLKLANEIFTNLTSNGTSADEAYGIAARIANERFGGINTAELARNKDFQNVLRTIFLAPDWAESNIRMGAGVAKTLANPANWGTPQAKPYLGLIRNTVGIYLGFALANKAVSGQWPWENGPGQEFNLATGSFDSRGRQRMYPLFGTAADFVRLPWQVISGASNNRFDVLSNLIRNRLSSPVGAGVSLFTNQDYRGREITSPDQSPLENMLGISGQIASGIGVPSQVQNIVQGIRGEATPEEVAAGILEAPLRYSGGANTESKRKTAANLKAMGATNQEINESFKRDTQNKPGLFSSLLGAQTTEIGEIPTDIKEQKQYLKDVTTFMEEGGVPPEDALKLKFFKGSSAASSSLEERMKAYSALKTALDNEDYTEEQKQAIIKASGATPRNVEYFVQASKDADVKLQEVLPLISSISDDKQRLTTLMQMRRMVGGRQVLTSEMITYLYENDIINQDEKDALNGLQYDEVNDKYYFTKSFLKKGSPSRISYSQAKSLYKNIEIPSYKELRSEQQIINTGDRLLQDILLGPSRGN